MAVLLFLSAGRTAKEVLLLSMRAGKGIRVRCQWRGDDKTSVDLHIQHPLKSCHTTPRVLTTFANNHSPVFVNSIALSHPPLAFLLLHEALHRPHSPHTTHPPHHSRHVVLLHLDALVSHVELLPDGTCISSRLRGLPPVAA